MANNRFERGEAAHLGCGPAVRFFSRTVRNLIFFVGTLCPWAHNASPYTKKRKAWRASELRMESSGWVAPVWLAADHRHDWQGTVSSDDIVEGVVCRHHLHRSGSEPINTSRRSRALSSSGSTTDETMHRPLMGIGWR